MLAGALRKCPLGIRARFPLDLSARLQPSRQLSGTTRALAPGGLLFRSLTLVRGFLTALRRKQLLLAALAAFAVIAPTQGWLRGQQQESALSDGEVEKLRETADDAPSRVMAFVEFLNQRADRIEKLTTGKRQPGREEDLHELIQQMTSIFDDLDDNLDDYNKRHWDIRKALPKLLTATERWGTALRTPPEDQEYNVARKLALESLKDVQDSAAQVLEEQKVWFKDHPPGKSKDKVKGG